MSRAWFEATPSHLVRRAIWHEVKTLANASHIRNGIERAEEIRERFEVPVDEFSKLVDCALDIYLEGLDDYRRDFASLADESPFDNSVLSQLAYSAELSRAQRVVLTVVLTSLPHDSDLPETFLRLRQRLDWTGVLEALASAWSDTDDLEQRGSDAP
jgi:hypothetical protein